MQMQLWGICEIKKHLQKAKNLRQNVLIGELMLLTILSVEKYLEDVVVFGVRLLSALDYIKDEVFRNSIRHSWYEFFNDRQENLCFRGERRQNELQRWVSLKTPCVHRLSSQAMLCTKFRPKNDS